MKLTENKLKRLINEVLNENMGNAKKIYDMLRDSYGSTRNFDVQNEGDFNQAVALAIGANLVNEVLSIINEELEKVHWWEYDDYTSLGGDYGDTYFEGRTLTEMKKKFIEQVAADMGSTAMQSYRSRQNI